MKIKSIIASSLLSVCLAVPAASALAEGVSAGAILGGTPFALKNYGVNVVKGLSILVSNETDSRAIVNVKLSGLKPGTTHIGHIHGGTCAALTPGAISII